MGGMKINCEMCGKESRLFKTEVEGSVMSLCGECSRFGKVISVVRQHRPVFKKPIKTKSPKEEESILAVLSDYGSIIKKKRESLKIKQEDFAKKLNEKASLIHKIEINQFEPSLELARKIEKFLHVKLIERQELKHDKVTEPKGDHFTIGDFIKVKK
jgi:putative transcription factor